MPSSSSLKQEFLKKWIMGLKICTSSKKKMSLLERKKAIKLSADIAMASARKGTTCWSRALIANASKEERNKVLVEQIMGPNIKNGSMGSCKKRNIIRSKKILKRSCGTIRRVRKSSVVVPNRMVVAKRLVKKRREVLKSLVPGGDQLMDDFSLIEATLDYLVSLRAQVDVMRSLASATDHQLVNNSIAINGEL